MLNCLRRKKEKGFTLIELMISMGLAFMVFLVIYMAYFISQTFFQKGVDALQEQTYVRVLLAKISDDLKYLTRVNSLSPGGDELEFEIFNRRVLETDPYSGDKRIEGSIISYRSKSSKDFEGIKFNIIEKKDDLYEWWLKFGHSQTPNDETEPYGYPDDMRDPVSGKQMLSAGEFDELLEQEEKREFLLDTVIFTPYDAMGEAITDGDDYATLKTARAIKVEISYKLRGRYGESLSEKIRKKTVSQMVPFVNYMTEESRDYSNGGTYSTYALLKSFYLAIKGEKIG